MTTPARHREADRVAVAFQVALTQYGAATVADALELWQDVPPLRGASAASRWLRQISRLVLFRRRQTRELARAYYRLERALRTGATIPAPNGPQPGEYEDINDLREEFAEQTQQAARQAPRPQAGRTEPTPSTAPPALRTPASEAPEDDDEDSELDRILVEEIERLREEEARIEREAEQELELILQALGPNNLNRKLDGIDLDVPASDVDRLRDEAHAQAGARQAAAAERIAMNGARSFVWSTSQRDKRVLGYVRLSRTGTPCGWCAMLISRGPVYRSEASAERKQAEGYVDGDKYHDNCHCYAMPVYSREQYENSDLFALNRQYAEQWPAVTRGLSGKAAVSAWRHFIRQSASASRRRTPSNVQEA